MYSGCQRPLFAAPRPGSHLSRAQRSEKPGDVEPRASSGRQDRRGTRAGPPAAPVWTGALPRVETAAGVSPSWRERRRRSICLRASRRARHGADRSVAEPSWIRVPVSRDATPECSFHETRGRLDGVDGRVPASTLGRRRTSSRSLGLAEHSLWKATGSPSEHVR